MNKVKIVQCNIRDLKALQRLGFRCFKEAYEPVENPEQFQSYLDRAFHKDQLSSELENPKSEFYFLWKEEELAGFIKVNIGDAQTEAMNENYMELERIYLLKKFYGQGLGRVLMQKAIELAHTKGKSKIWLGVWEENISAISFYKHLGFKVIGEHTFMVGELAEIDLMMELVLK